MVLKQMDINMEKKEPQLYLIPDTKIKSTHIRDLKVYVKIVKLQGEKHKRKSSVKLWLVKKS